MLIDDNKDADSQQPVDDTEEYKHLVREHQKSIDCIKAGIESGDLSTAAEAWFELPKEVKTGLWRAPRDGGCFSTEERRVIKTKEFRISYYGENNDAD